MKYQKLFKDGFAKLIIVVYTENCPEGKCPSGVDVSNDKQGIRHTVSAACGMGISRPTLECCATERCA